MNSILDVTCALPFASIAVAGALQVWDEMYGNRGLKPMEGMDRPTAKIQWTALDAESERFQEPAEDLYLAPSAVPMFARLAALRGRFSRVPART
jgi:hypothetical protein